MQPLGLITENVPLDTLEKLRTIENLDFSSVRSRMNVDFPTPEDKMDEYEREVKRFFGLIALDGSNGHVVSEKIDALWHYFVLHTREYSKFCQKVFGNYIHHVPILPDQKHTLADAYLKTRDAYTRFFGPPPKHLWGDNEQICWGGCDERSSSEGDISQIKN